MSLFKEYLELKKKKNEKILVYLNATQQVKDKDRLNNKKEDRINNVMLSGLVNMCDDTGLVLERQECFVPYHSILSIKPDKGR